MDKHLRDMIPAWVDGKLTAVSKLDVHKRGLRHKAVSVFLLDEVGRILIQRRALGKYHTPGLWANSCCTHPLWDEDAFDCARRRLEEELGVKRVAPVWRQQVEYRAAVGNNLIEHELVDIFVGNMPASHPMHINSDEVMDISWVGLDELECRIKRAPELFTPWLRIYLSEHKQAILGG